MSNVIDFSDAALACAHRKAPCPEASRLAELIGHSPMIFDGGTPELLHKVTPATFERFKAVRLALTQAAGEEYADALAWVALDCPGIDALGAVYHEILGIPKISTPIIMVGAEMKVALSTCDLFDAEGEDFE